MGYSFTKCLSTCCILCTSLTSLSSWRYRGEQDAVCTFMNFHYHLLVLGCSRILCFKFFNFVQ